MEKLFGKIISHIYINKDRTAIAFELHNGDKYWYIAGGDCCSETFIESISNVDCLKEKVVVEVIDRCIGENSLYNKNRAKRDYDYNRVEVEKVYAYELKTLQGICTIDFRNYSNGYYGGYLTEDNELSKTYDKKKWKCIL